MASRADNQKRIINEMYQDGGVALYWIREVFFRPANWGHRSESTMREPELQPDNTSAMFSGPDTTGQGYPHLPSRDGRPVQLDRFIAAWMNAR